MCWSLSLPSLWGTRPGSRWLRNATNVSAAAAKRGGLASTAFTTAEASVFQLTPRGNGPSSMRLMEAMVAGALPVMIDDWTHPFGDPLCDFAVRWTMRPSNPRLDLLAKLLRHFALRDPVGLQTRRVAMGKFLRAHHPVWFDTRNVRRSITAAGHEDLCAARRDEPASTRKNISSHFFDN